RAQAIPDVHQSLPSRGGTGGVLFGIGMGVSIGVWIGMLAGGIGRAVPGSVRRAPGTDSSGSTAGAFSCSVTLNDPEIRVDGGSVTRSNAPPVGVRSWPVVAPFFFLRPR